MFILLFDSQTILQGVARKDGDRIHNNLTPELGFFTPKAGEEKNRKFIVFIKFLTRPPKGEE